MEFTRRSEYAIAVLMALAQKARVGEGERLTSARIAEEYRLPANLIPQIVAALSRKGWISGVRGVGGGLSLSVDPATISVREVVEMMEGPIAINPCLAGDSICSKQPDCALSRVWARAQRALLDVLENTSIMDLAKDDLSNP